MSELIPTKPYMVRAIHDWCVDNAFTPHLLVVVNDQTRVPVAYIKDGEIVLNLNYTATKDLHINNDAIVFSARFGGVSQNLYVPMNAVRGIFARENGQGMFFELDKEHAAQQAQTLMATPVHAEKTNKTQASPEKKKPNLTIVK